MKHRWYVALLCLALGALAAPDVEARKRFFFGGGFGLGFGDVNYADLSAVLGVSVTPRFTTGLRVAWRQRQDDRFGREVTTNDYGTGLFGRYRIKQPFYVQAEYERLSYEFIRTDLSTDRDSFDSFLVGGGVAQPLGKNVSFFATALYNLSYDSSDARSPYDSPLILRAGIGVYF